VGMSDDPLSVKSGSSRQDVEGELSAEDRSRADTDQTDADTDQSASDVDQTASERDQRASDRDQASADADQAESDKTHRSRSGWAETRRARARSAIERDIATHARIGSSRVRDHVAELRDRAADERDATADARDKLAAALDAELASLEDTDSTTAEGQTDALAEALQNRRAAAAARERAAFARVAAARDRKAARTDRRRAAVDRERANAEIALEGTDYLTGALGRRAGLAALTRELARTRRAQQPLLIAFIDVDGLKALNDEHGHLAGDDILRAVVKSLEGMLRSYDVVIRYGGDEFICALCDQVPTNINSRFEDVFAEFSQIHHTHVSVGVAEAQANESPEDLIARADAAMIAARDARRGRHR
jgi:diguanylate cyclase (GGDEF)-like protein